MCIRDRLNAFFMASILPISSEKKSLRTSTCTCKESRLFLDVYKRQAENFRFIEEESNKYEASRLLHDTGNETVVVNPPYPPMSQGELDHSFDLPYTRMPHPKYK